MQHWAKSHVWPIVTISGLVLLNVVLIALLLNRPQAQISAEPAPAPSSPRSSSESSPSETDSPTPSPSKTDSPTPSPDPTSEGTPTSTSSPARRLLTMGSADQGWRATVGDCDTAGVVEVSDDGGKTWQRTSDAQLSPVSRIKALNKNTLFAIGGAKDCKASYVISYTSGEAWETRNPNLEGTWHITPGNRKDVKAAGGDRSQPCDKGLVDLAAVDEQNAAALCTDGTVVSTNDAGQNWNDIGTLAGGSSLSADDSAYVAAALNNDCDGVSVLLFTPETQNIEGRTQQCAPTSGAKPGEIAVARAGDRLWVWAGTKVAVSTDAGRTW